MAFVADFNEEELQRALAAAGGASALSEGPSGGAGAASAPAGPAVPAAGGAPVAGGGQGTGFVNLSRYFDANEAGANASAQALVDPLKLNAADMTSIGDAAAGAVQRDKDPNQIVPGPNDIVGVTGPLAPPNASLAATNAASQSAYDKTTESAYKAAQDRARQEAVSAAGVEKVQAGRNYLEDPNKLSAAMSKDGKTPSQFDAYLTGAAMPNAYANLTAYYGADGSDQGRSGQGGGRPMFVPPTPQEIDNQRDAAEALDPDLRRKSRSKGGW